MYFLLGNTIFQSIKTQCNVKIFPFLNYQAISGTFVIIFVIFFHSMKIIFRSRMLNLVFLPRHKLYPTPYFCYQLKTFLLPRANCKFKILTPSVVFHRLSTQDFRTPHNALCIQSTPGRFVLYRGEFVFGAQEGDSFLPSLSTRPLKMVKECRL